MVTPGIKCPSDSHTTWNSSVPACFRFTSFDQTNRSGSSFALPERCAAVAGQLGSKTITGYTNVLIPSTASSRETCQIFGDTRCCIGTAAIGPLHTFVYFLSHKLTVPSTFGHIYIRSLWTKVPHMLPLLASQTARINLYMLLAVKAVCHNIMDIKNDAGSMIRAPSRLWWRI